MSKTDEALVRLNEKVAKISGASDSIIAWVRGAAGMIRDAADDPDQINAIADALDTKADEVAAVVAENPQ